MLKKAHIVKAVAKRCDAIDAHLEDYCAHREPEALHRLRVEIKKLQAIIALLQECSGEEELHIKSFKKVYKGAGRIREAHVNLHLLESLHLESPAFAAEQHRVIEEESAVFCANRRAYRHDVRHGKHALFERAIPIRTPRVADFFKSRLLQLSAFFAPSFIDTSGLHAARKEVKDLMYVHALLPEGMAEELPVHAPYLDALQDTIGQWHDTVAVMALLKDFGRAEGGEPAQMEIHNRVLLEEIRAMTMDFRVKAEKRTM